MNAISSIKEVLPTVYNIYIATTSVIEGRERIPRDLFTQRDLFEELVGAVEIVVDDNEIVHTGFLSKGDFGEGGLEALLDRGFGFCAAALEAVAKGGHGGGRDEEVDGVEVGFLDLADTLDTEGLWREGEGGRSKYLCLDVEDAATALFLDGADGGKGGAVKVA
ncbi:hypothetical protein D9619_006174 [Psilocybe cf. subviscida]|uniref:Uncharacterized protein n=1 Tax=Psilocybe cf. subviscida TaxID=2480587 RepID=A0A8H5B5I3_9AGAR|nr:hypothetical protein D9619_006174 [Psilocybe cf. subviscida]